MVDISTRDKLWLKEKKWKSKLYLGHFQTGNMNSDHPIFFPCIQWQQEIIVSCKQYSNDGLFFLKSYFVIFQLWDQWVLLWIWWREYSAKFPQRFGTLIIWSAYLFLVTRHTTQLQHNKWWAVEFAKLYYTSFLLHTLGCFSGGFWIWFYILHSLKISCCYWKVLNFETSTGVR